MANELDAGDDMSLAVRQRCSPRMIRKEGVMRPECGGCGPLYIGSMLAGAGGHTMSRATPIDNYVWNDGVDRATTRSHSGILVDTYFYSGSGFGSHHWVTC